MSQMEQAMDVLQAMEPGVLALDDEALAGLMPTRLWPPAKRRGAMSRAVSRCGAVWPCLLPWCAAAPR